MTKESNSYQLTSSSVGHRSDVGGLPCVDDAALHAPLSSQESALVIVNAINKTNTEKFIISKEKKETPQHNFQFEFVEISLYLLIDSN
jgi:hypothetical protein